MRGGWLSGHRISSDPTGKEVHLLSTSIAPSPKRKALGSTEIDSSVSKLAPVACGLALAIRQHAVVEVPSAPVREIDHREGVPYAGRTAVTVLRPRLIN